MIQKVTTLMDIISALILLVTGLYIQVSFESWLTPFVRMLIAVISLVLCLVRLGAVLASQALERNEPLATETN